jgi:hypothetical protein
MLAVTALARVSVTVYNNDLALIRETRALDIKKGQHQLSFTDVAAQIDPTSVSFNALTDPGSIQLLEQNFEYDLVGTERLLEKYLDESVVVQTEQGNVYTGTLSNARSGDVILMTVDGKVMVIKSSQITRLEFPAMPQGLKTRPTLVWNVVSEAAGERECEISYLTSGMMWHSNYVAVAGEDDRSLDLSAWVTINNRSGATFKDAQIKVVAGDVSRAQPEVPKRLARADIAMAAEAPRFEEKAFFEYHLYTLNRPATIRDRQIKQIALFPPTRTDVNKRYVYEGQRHPEDVQVQLRFMNRSESGLGMPLPKGVIRVYKRDDDGSQQFIGEDRIDHTPVDEEVTIKVGNAFDIVGERVVKQSEKMGPRTQRQTVAITLRNHKKEPVTIQVIERFWGEYKFVGTPPKIVKREARRVDFEAVVPGDGETTLDYTAIITR